MLLTSRTFRTWYMAVCLGMGDDKGTKLSSSFSKFPSTTVGLRNIDTRWPFVWMGNQPTPATKRRRLAVQDDEDDEEPVDLKEDTLPKATELKSVLKLKTHQYVIELILHQHC